MLNTEKNRQRLEQFKKQLIEYARNYPILWLPVMIIIFLLLMILGLGADLFKQF